MGLLNFIIMKQSRFVNETSLGELPKDMVETEVNLVI
jgi:hypothetical protein